MRRIGSFREGIFVRGCCPFQNPHRCSVRHSRGFAVDSDGIIRGEGVVYLVVGRAAKIVAESLAVSPADRFFLFSSVLSHANSGNCRRDLRYDGSPCNRSIRPFALLRRRTKAPVPRCSRGALFGQGAARRKTVCRKESASPWRRASPVRGCF